MRRTLWSWPVRAFPTRCLAALLLFGCDGEPSKPTDSAGAGVDSGPAADSDANDSGASDSGSPDSGTGDSGGDSAAADSDGDGTIDAEDCDDQDAGVFPGADETCDGVDQDCDGEVDEDALDAPAWYVDADGDGFGVDPAWNVCDPGDGYAAAGGDCDDTDVSVFPDAPEADCTDPVDRDCDGSPAFADADGDGVAACLDCDDLDPQVLPGAAEACNSKDDDCDGEIDEDPVDPLSWYADLDGDGFGDPAATLLACTAPLGSTADPSDCDDTDAAVHPGADESDCTILDDRDCDGVPPGDDLDADGVAACVDCDDTEATVLPGGVEACDGLDNNCNGAVDDVASATIWYADADEDGFGDNTRSVAACDAPAGFVADNTDCEDGDARIHPGADEADCTDLTDYNCDGSAGSSDRDGDGYAACQDCDDSDRTVSPVAVETCDGVDDDCDGLVDDDPTNPTTWYQDADGDRYGTVDVTLAACTLPAGYSAFIGDCDDSNPDVSPAAPEQCNGLDDDCDGGVDLTAGAPPAGASTWYVDADADGYGDPATGALRCEPASSGVTNGEDCDDAADWSWPGADERCDGADNDCDGVVDDDAVDPLVWYTDADGDGYGAGTPIIACDAPAGTVGRDGDCDDLDVRYAPGADESDCADPADYNCDGASGLVDTDADGFAACEECDDNDAAVRPDAQEICDPADTDEDCSGFADDLDPGVDPSTWGAWYPDRDGDAYGDPAGEILACDTPETYVADGSDCDDVSARYHPGAAEPDCTDPEDYDCDGQVAFEDADGDGFAACVECDDSVAGTNPDALERCDGRDNNCDGEVDEATAVDVSAWYLDEDGDGVGGDSAVLACDAPDAYVVMTGDCDDADPARSPWVPERCNGVDDNCDGLTDGADAEDLSAWYADLDEDEFGDPASLTLACVAPEGTVADATDCDDTDGAVSPAATEICDDAAIDEDCSGASDDADPGLDLSTRRSWYADDDGDGHGDPATGLELCVAPDGYVASNLDCDDTRMDVSPSEVEVCDPAAIDEDCSGNADDADPGVSAGSLGVWYADADLDGFGDPETELRLCVVPFGFVADDTDCDDDRDDVNPAGVEVCDPLDTDEDCSLGADDADPGVALDGRVTWYADADGDTYGDASAALDACDVPEAYVGQSGDCDDTRASVSPDGHEVCDALDLDEDCSGVADDADTTVDASTRSPWFPDADADGYGVVDVPLYACDTPSGRAAEPTDCDDTRADVHPGAVEVCDPADTNEDCNLGADDLDPFVDGSTRSTWFADVDGDGYGDPLVAFDACDLPPNYAADATDCDDTRATISPAALEQCDADNLDEDCSGAADDADPAVVPTTSWYVDADLDGYGDPAVSVLRCDPPSGYGADRADCDDGDPAISPAATEVCDSADTDEDCDGLADDADSSVSATTQVSTYPDADGDGHGYGAAGVTACDAVEGYATTSDDCDDTEASVYPGAAEICADGLDQACDGLDECAWTGLHDDIEADEEWDGNSPGGAGYLGGSGTFGDLDGDGIDDLVLGDGQWDSSTVSAGQNVGKLFVLRGAEGGVTDTLTSPYATILGSTAGDRFGQQLASISDLTGDGRDELIAGAYQENASGSDSGAVYLITGALTTSSTLSSSTWRVRLTGGSASTTSHPEALGWAVAQLGDVTGDGIDDWAAGGYNYGGSNRYGRLSVVGGDLAAGTYDASSLQLPFVVTGSSSYVRIGASIAGEIDFDGDGVNDLITLGADATGVGTVYGFDGPVSGQVTSANASYTVAGLSVVLTNTTTKEISPNPALASAGDNNGDGYADLLLGADSADFTGATNAGAAYLMLGPGGNFDTVTNAAFRLAGVNTADTCGRSVYGPGDVDGDGFDDLLIGVPGYDSPANAGGVALVYGPSTGNITYTSSTVVRWDGTASGANLGAMVVGGGDVNADTLPDLLIGAPASTVGSTTLGRARLVYGRGE